MDKDFLLENLYEVSHQMTDYFNTMLVYYSTYLGRWWFYYSTPEQRLSEVRCGLFGAKEPSLVVELAVHNLMVEDGICSDMIPLDYSMEFARLVDSLEDKFPDDLRLYRIVADFSATYNTKSNQLRSIKKAKYLQLLDSEQKNLSPQQLSILRWQASYTMGKSSDEN